MVTEALLFYIAKKVGLFGTLKTSTMKIAKSLKVSQQTISRKLRELEKEGFIQRIVSPLGVEIRLRQNAVSFLKKRYNTLKSAFEKKTVLKGKVTKGLGEGSYYMKIYNNKFEKTLGFMPYPGTLNIRVDVKTKKEFLANLNKKTIGEFKTKSRSYGAVYCYDITINDTTQGALILPVRARHGENVVELIAPMSLKNKFNLNEGDTIKVSV